MISQISPELRVEEALLVMRQAPLGHDRPAAGDDAGQPLGGQRHVGQAHAGVDREVVHALLRLLDQRVAEQVPGQFLRAGRRPSPGPGRSGPCPIGTGELRRIHSRVSWMFSPVERSITVSAPQRVDQIIFSTSSSMEELDRRVADVGVDLDQEVAADDHRLRLGVIDVGGDDRAAAGDLVAHELRARHPRAARRIPSPA